MKVRAGTDLALRAYVGSIHVAELRKNLAINPSFEGSSGSVEVRRNLLLNPSFEAGATQTPWTNLLTNPSFENTSGTAEVWRNLAINPSFETTTPSFVVRTNLALNPKAIAGGATWTTAMGAAGAATSTDEVAGGPAGVCASWRKALVTSMPTGSPTSINAGTPTSGYITVTAGTTYTASIYGYNSAGHAAARCDILWYDSAGTFLTSNTSTPTAMAAGVWERRSLTVAAPASAARAIVLQTWSGGSTIPVGTTLGATALLFEAMPVMLSYFDGGFSPDSDMTAAFTGTANNSTSTLTGQLVSNASTSGQCAGISSTQWASTGTKSLRQVPTTASNGSNTRIAGNSGSLSGSGVTFVAGNTYTITAKCRIGTVQGGTLNSEARRITVTYNGTGGTTVRTAQAANTLNAVTSLSVTFTLPADATSCDVLAWNGASAGNGDTWWDDLLIVATQAAPAYFDGANGNGDADLTQSWTGTANASASILSGSLAVNTTGTGAAVISSTLWAWPGTRSLRIIPNTNASANGAVIAGAAGSLTGLGVTFVAGQQYTIQATLRLIAAQAGSMHANARRISATMNGTGGGDFVSTQATNAAGETVLTLTFTVPADATNCRITLNGGTSAGNGDSWWDRVVLVTGAAVPGYFDGVAPVRVRENLIRDPQITSAASVNNTWDCDPRWYGGGTWAGTTTHNVAMTPTGIAATTGGRKTWTATDSTTPLDISWALTYGRVPVTPGVTYTISGYWRASWSMGAPVNNGVSVNFYSVASGGTATVVDAASAAAPTAGVWQRVSGTFTVPAGMYYMSVYHKLYMNSAPGNWPIVGSTLDFSGGLAERGSTLRAWFDGANTPTDALTTWNTGWIGTTNDSVSYVREREITAAWTGTANASTSTLSITQVNNVGSANTGVSLALPIRSTLWNVGNSLRIVPQSTGADTGATIAGSSGGLSGAGVTFVPGKTYTVTGTIRLPAAQTGTVDARARTIFFADSVTGFAGGVMSTAATNGPGATRVSLTFTVNAAATWAVVRLYNGAASLGGDVFWDDVTLVEGSSSGVYFDGDRRPRLRENLAKNPRAISSGGPWATGLGGGAATSTFETSGGPSVLATWYKALFTSTASGSGTTLGMSGTAGGYSDVVEGVTYTASIYGYNSAGHPGVRCDITWYTSSGATISGTTGTASAMAAGVWERRSNTAVAPPGAARAVVTLAFGGANTVMAGTTTGASGILLEPTSTMQGYFDGTNAPVGGSYITVTWTGSADASSSYGYDADLTAAWTGTANASASTLSGSVPLNVATATEAAAVSSTNWAELGTKSVKIVPNTASNASAVIVAGSAASLAGQGITFVPGRTYTVMAAVHLFAAMTGTQHANARRITATFNGTGGTTVQSAQAPNTPGTTYPSLTFTVPADATIAYVQLWNGASGGGGNVAWDTMLVIEEDYDGQYFDGSHAEAGVPFWNGTADASTSQWWSKA